jgi:uncharacterized protein (DUF1697 family)
MPYIAFLRAINVGGHAVVSMADLKRAFVNAGAENVSTYIQSGNVIFDAPASSAAQARLFTAIQTNLDTLIGKKVDVMYRTDADLQGIIKADPFKGIDVQGDLKLYVTFLKDKPARKPRLPLIVEKDGLEIINVRGNDIFVVSRPVGKGRYGVPNLFFEKEFGIPATTRNWNTVRKILAKLT